MPERMQTWVRDRKPSSAKETAQMAEEYIRHRPWEGESGKKLIPKTSFRLAGRESGGERKRATTMTIKKERPEPDGSKPWMLPKFDPTRGPRCFQCHEYGHIASLCPTRTKTVLLAKMTEGLIRRMGRIGNQEVDTILLDSGATVSIVNKKWVPDADLRKDMVRVVGYSGDVRVLPTAEVDLRVMGEMARVLEAVQDSLSYDALAGMDVPAFQKYMQGTRKPQQVLAVTTRAQGRRRAEERDREKTADKENRAVTTQPDSSDEGEDETEENGKEATLDHGESSDNELEDVSTLFPLDDSLFRADKGMPREKKSRAARRKERQAFASVEPGDHPLDGGAKVMLRAQECDPSLAGVRRRAEEEEEGGPFELDQGLFYRIWKPP